MRLAILLLAGCVVTRAPKLEERPRWRLAKPSAVLDRDCVIAEAFVRKSGKEGFGVAVQLKSRGDCKVEIIDGTLVFDEGHHEVHIKDLVFDLEGRSVAYAWVPVAFKNTGDREHAVLRLSMIVAGKRADFPIEVVQR